MTELDDIVNKAAQEFSVRLQQDLHITDEGLKILLQKTYSEGYAEGAVNAVNYTFKHIYDNTTVRSESK